jgi:hypothetical protein
VTSSGKGGEGRRSGGGACRSGREAGRAGSGKWTARPPEEEARRRGGDTRMGREGRLAKRARRRGETEVERGGRRVGPTVVCWLGVGDIGKDGCGKTDAVLRNLDDQAEYSILGYANGVRRVLPTLYLIALYIFFPSLIISQPLSPFLFLYHTLLFLVKSRWRRGIDDLLRAGAIRRGGLPGLGM